MVEYFCCFWQTQQNDQCILRSVRAGHLSLSSGLHLFWLFSLYQWIAVTAKYQFTRSPKGAKTLLPFSALPLPPKIWNDQAMKHTTNVAICNSACCIHLVYSFTPMKSNTHSMWESFIILESKYPLKYLHFTVKRIAKHKVMYKLKYSSFWSMGNAGRNEFTTTNHIFKNSG